MTATYGPLGRLGRYTATHFRAVVDRLGAGGRGARLLRAAGRDGAVGRGLGGDWL